jgi:hypothetical protein
MRSKKISSARIERKAPVTIRALMARLNRRDDVRVEKYYQREAKEDLFVLHLRGEDRELIARQDLILFALEHDVLDQFEEVVGPS